MRSKAPLGLRFLRNISQAPVRLAGKVHSDAFGSSSRDSGGGGCPALVGKSLHPDAVVHQIDFERRSCDAVVLWLLNAFGVIHSVSRMRIG